MLRHLKMYYVLVALPYVLLLVGAYIFFEPIKRTILNNPIPHLNYAIIVIIVTGGILILINARRLVREAGILREFSRAIHAKTDSATLREMANGYTGDLSCILQMVASSGDRSISHQEQAALEHELSNARSRLVRRNALPQYLTGLLVAMGLLGTFIGLLATLADISVLIGSFADIDMNNIEPIQVFRVMIERMKAPMTSMGIAFSTSMFGLLGSISIGLMMLGIRRLQGDILSVLSSEVARHIEVALSFESISFRGGEVSGAISGEAVDLTAKILLRIEERLAEAGRQRQRALSAEIDDFKKQRADMLQALAAQTEANNNFRSQLQQLGSQLGGIFESMEKANGEISGQISELTVNLAGDAKETHKLLATQVDEQKRLRAALDGYNIKEWLAETARMQQRALAAEIDDFKKQRADMLQALSEQTEANHDFRGELQQLGVQLGSIFNSMEKNSCEISSQISELTVHAGADAKESHRLLAVTSSNIRNDLQQIGTHLAKVTEKGHSETAARISELMDHLAAGIKESQQLIERVNRELSGDLKQLDSQLGAISQVSENGHAETAARISELMDHLDTDIKESQQLLESASNGLRCEMKQLDSQLGAISQVSEKGHEETAVRISELMLHLSADIKESQLLLESTGKDLRVDLEQLVNKLGIISEVTEKGSSETAGRISELSNHLAADTKESFRQLNIASNDVRSELRQLGIHLRNILDATEKGGEKLTTLITTLMSQVPESHNSIDLPLEEDASLQENEEEAIRVNE